jgi:hypothetical protein
VYLLKDIISQSGIEFYDTSQRGYFNREGQYRVHNDQTLIKGGNDYVGSWVAIEPRIKMILGTIISIENLASCQIIHTRSLIGKY